ncbi:MAG: NAD(P)-dependent oxidoreductase [Rhodospirillaceae bacterium]|nr:NAD(P)-dependent oxidoreductase [Rhodospirillaceae bacterium]
MTKIAFIGFGEAAGLLTDGLAEAGADVAATFDILINNPDKAIAHKEKAGSKGVLAAKDAEQAVQAADIIISAVTSKEILIAAKNVAPHLTASQIYMDINSASPDAKQEAAKVIEASGADFVEAAVMDLVPPHGHKVPMLLAGAKAETLAETLSTYGMNVKAIGSEIGNASSVKMVRSVFMKGFSAILLESLVAAHKLNAADAVLDSLQVTYPQMNWHELAGKSMSRLIQHAKRQSEEMSSVAATLEELGVEPITAKATGARLGWLADLELAKASDSLPETYDEFLKILDQHS